MEQDSITAVAHAIPGDVTPTNPHTPTIKLKGRQRLLKGFQRMSSSPSLAKAGRTTGSGYRTGGKASISCVSLSSGGSPYVYSYGSSWSSELSNGYSTAPTSAMSTPGADTPFFDPKARIRLLEGNVPTPTSCPLPSELRPSASRPGLDDDYFSRPVRAKKPVQRRPNFNFWADMPAELRTEVLSYLRPKELVRCSAVSKQWHRMCFDGQLWANLDTSLYYKDIPAEALVNIITAAGPFVRDLNLRGCVQLRDAWGSKGLAEACRNLENFSLQGCRIDRSSIHCFLLQNSRLVHINLSALAGATNAAMKIIAQHCPKVEHLNVSWCNNVDTRGLRHVVEGCARLKDLRAGEVRGWDDVDFMRELFERNTLERLMLTHCDSVNDDSLAALLEGVDSEVDILTGRAVVPPRRFKHLDLTQCRGLTDKGIAKLAHRVPELEGLQLSKCSTLTDEALTAVLPTLPRLTHLDLEELDQLTNASLVALAAAPSKPVLAHLGISYCELLGDAGMLPVLKACTHLRSLDMDNTRVSDLVLAEAAALVRTRNKGARPLAAGERPRVGLRVVAYDCANVTWTGVREVLSRNVEACSSSLSSTASSGGEVIQLKCFYNWQPTVEEHTRRVLRGDGAAAARLERKWAEWMMLNEEVGAATGGGGGHGGRRRRRRAREAQALHADEEGVDGGTGAGGVGRRRRARSGPGGCVVM